MKLIGIEFGRVSLLADLVDLGRRTGIHLPEAAALVQQRYSFVHAPTVLPASEQQPMYRFERGVLKKGVKTHTFSAFEVHPHGLVVQGTDTDAGEAFFEDFFEFGIENLGMKKPSREPSMVFLSALVVEFEEDFNKVLKTWKELSELCGASLKSTYHIDQKVQVGSLNLRPDPQDLTPRQSVLIGDFSLDRRIYEPYEHNRFYAMAPLRTDDHIALLKRFEKIALLPK